MKGWVTGLAQAQCLVNDGRETNVLLLINMGCDGCLITVYFQSQVSDVEESAGKSSYFGKIGRAHV